jgi:kynurenine formamidase
MADGVEGSDGSLAALQGALAGMRAIDLEQPRYQDAPTFAAHRPGFEYFLHRRHEPGLGSRTSASGVIVAAEHSGTHIDAICHQAVDLRMHGGCDVTAQNQGPHGFTELGVETIEPIIARGVLLDVAAAAGVDRLPNEHLVSAEELAAAESAAGVELGAGDVAVIRTGNGAIFDDAENYLNGPGVGTDGARWLAERKPLAVGADNVALDFPHNKDPELGTLPCHVVLIVENGIYIVENLDLEELARQGVAEFLFVCLPLKMRGVTGSPVRPIALVTDTA